MSSKLWVYGKPKLVNRGLPTLLVKHAGPRNEQGTPSYSPLLPHSSLQSAGGCQALPFGVDGSCLAGAVVHKD